MANNISAMATAWVKISTYHWYAEPEEKGDDLVDPDSSSWQNRGGGIGDHPVTSRSAMNGEQEDAQDGKRGRASNDPDSLRFYEW
jgi:hypothetical protein